MPLIFLEFITRVTASHSWGIWLWITVVFSVWNHSLNNVLHGKSASSLFPIPSLLLFLPFSLRHVLFLFFLITFHPQITYIVVSTSPVQILNVFRIYTFEAWDFFRERIVTDFNGKKSSEWRGLRQWKSSKYMYEAHMETCPNGKERGSWLNVAGWKFWGIFPSG